MRQLAMLLVALSASGCFLVGYDRHGLAENEDSGSPSGLDAAQADADRLPPGPDAGPEAGGGTDDAGSPDAGFDAGPGFHDAGIDSGAMDAGSLDAGQHDAGEGHMPDAAIDGGSTDAGATAPDAAAPDAASKDGGPVDSGTPPDDAGTTITDSGVPPHICNAGCTCTADYCDLNCPWNLGSACTFDCRGVEDCDVSCASPYGCNVNCENSTYCHPLCSNGAACTFNCRGTDRCRPTCQFGSACTIDCRTSAECSEVRCETGSRCLVRCAPGATDCKFEYCLGSAQTCETGEIVCNRACP